MSSVVLNSCASLIDLPEDAGISTFLWHLFTKKKYTDVYFNLEYNGSNTLFSAHKIVLALRSPYFADEFYENEKKIDNGILLTDVNPEAFEAMLIYLYDYMPSMKTPNMVFEVYKVAERFQVISLMTLCLKTLNESIKIVPSNVFDMLEVSDYLQNTCTKDKCLKFLQENTKEIKSWFKLSEITPSMMSTLARLKEMSLDSVMDFFRWIFEWAENRACENSGGDARSKAEKTREALEEFLPQLPFVSLSYKQFAELYNCHKDVFNEDEVIAIFMNLAVPGSHTLPDWYNEKCTLY